MVIGVITLIGLVVAGVGLFRAVQVDRESRRFVDDSIPRIVDGWDDRNLIAIASPGLLRAASQDDLDRLFAVYMKLGRVLHVEPAMGQATVSFTTRNGRGMAG